MAKKQKNISWTPIIITAMILIFLIVIIFGFNSNDSVYENSKSTKTSDNLFDDNFDETETITISGMNGERTINVLEKNIILVVSGLGNIITISEETKISKIVLSGQNNQINLCQNIHSPQLVESGLDNNINYLNC